jgi:transcriptional regulator GlxA family with amidase domain
MAQLPTTHHTCFDELAERAPRTTLVRDLKCVDNGRIILSGGISAGIDMSLYVVARLIDRATAVKVAREMEYDWAGSEPVD